MSKISVVPALCLLMILCLAAACTGGQEQGYETLRVGLIDVPEGASVWNDDSLVLNARMALRRHSDDGVVMQGANRVRIQFLSLAVTDKPQAAKQTLYEAVYTYGASVIIGGARSRIAADIAMAAEKLRIPYLATAGSSPAATEGFFFSFSSTPHTGMQALHYASFLRDTLKARKIAMLVEENTPFSANFADELRLTHLDNGGRIGLQRFYSATESPEEIEEKLKDIAQSGVDALILRGDSPGCFPIARQLGELGYRKPLLCVHCASIGRPEIPQPKLPMPLYTLSYWNPDGYGRLAREYIADFLAESGERPTENDALAYDAVVRLTEAVKTASDTKPASIRKALAAQQSMTGVLGQYELNPFVRMHTIWRLALLDGKVAIEEVLLPGIHRKLSQ